MIRLLAIVAAVGWLAAAASVYMLKRQIETTGELRRMLVEASAKLKEIDHARELRDSIDTTTRRLDDTTLFDRLR